MYKTSLTLCNKKESPETNMPEECRIEGITTKKIKGRQNQRSFIQKKYGMQKKITLLNPARLYDQERKERERNKIS